VKKRLAELADIRTGFPFRKAVEPVAGGTLAVVQMKDVDESAGLNPDACLRINDEAGRYGQHLLCVGDVLLQTRGSKFPAVVFDKPLHAIAALGLVVLRPRPEILPEYLSWLLNHPKTRDALRTVARGSYIPFLSRTELLDLQVSVPTFAIQKRIAAVNVLQRRVRHLQSELIELDARYTDALVWNAATSNSRK
jgi:hypothetical protein